ncbi:fumarylacetoacetate hydrolase family protein [Paenactinomyces guangxiensis]|uniref:Fumarylacetoacetate hydrolase family protein n=1 Tax=Paenactinomyces guangxiensis TaxID=1490290 RepID=A0A7W2A7A8_9BACL|nr:fumarylacetoacetate hydrolase family protein [Paenactinomyces guangxiensis]MBA4493355.1 fumarylacetoacetate hydrolase family protein [Paenactinomyces guangxiensis]MBH8593419.1 fumarylacetoacetate hydrolase family protein [Paenactinomyces guangxiensis]
MHFIMYQVDGKQYLGIKQQSHVIDLKALSDEYCNRFNQSPPVLLTDMLTLIQQGDKAKTYVKTLTDWLETNKDTDLSVKHLLDDVSILAPLCNPGKVVCVGNNYMDHCREQNVEPPKKPLIFSKWPSCIIGPEAEILLPENSEQVDFEAELAVVIGKRGKNIAEEEAFNYVFGYTILNDISARDVQFADGQWVRGKSFDTFAPLGPAIVTADEIENPHHLAIKLDLNGEVLQDSNTSHMIFKIPYLISYLSKGFTFEPGDIIATGTPHGVGVFRNPQVFLKHGDICTVEIEKIGLLKNRVR